MSFSKSVEKILVLEFMRLGFSCENEGQYWVFTRSIDSNLQMIQIDRSDLQKNTVRITYSTNGHIVNSFHFLNQPTQDWHFYSDEQSLNGVLEQINYITNEYALRWFEEHAEKRDDTILFNVFLEDEFQVKAESFYRRNELKKTEPETLKHLDKLLKNNPSTEVVLFATYYLGEVFIENLGGGKWTLTSDNTLMLINIGGLEGFEIEPYTFVRNCIESDDINLYMYFEVWRDLITNSK